MTSDSEAPPDWLGAIVGQGLRAYPRECCGVIVRSVCAPPVRAIPLANVAFRATGFGFASADLFSVAAAGRRRGDRWMAIYHSHADSPETLSAADLRMGLALAGVAQVVISIARSRVMAVGYYRLRQDRTGYERVEIVAFEEIPGVAW